MKFKPYFLTLVLMLIFLRPLPVSSQSFHFNESCRLAYHEIISLRFEKGKQIIAEEKKSNPDNLMPHLLENYLDFLNIILSEDERLLSAFKSAKNKRLNALKKGDAQSPWLRHTQAEISLHYAMAALLFKEYFSGLMEFRKAYSLFEENAALHPGFKPGMKSFYIVRSLLGAIPEKYHWGLKILGMSGNLSEGLNGLENLSGDDWGTESFMKDEAALALSMLLLHLEGNRETAWETVSEKFPLEGNLFTYYAAIKIAVFSHQNDAALKLFERLPAGNEYASIPVMHYFRGLALLQQLDASSMFYFQKFIHENKSKNLIKSAWHKMAWTELVRGNQEGYHSSMKRVKDNGTTLSEADKQAQREAEQATAPHPELLKARLLFDGGYFEKANQILEKISQDSFMKKQHQLEFTYRQARVFDALGDTLFAIEKYMETLSNGKKEPYYYAANAALNLGLIYETKGDKELARKYFNECLSMDNHEYKISLHQKAKAGLERVN